MKINRETKISALIKKNPKSIEAIVSVNPRFKKLRNPLLRGILASRTSLGDAARIGKCDIGEIFNALSAIGFQPENETPDRHETNEHAMNPEITGAIQASKVISLDVRPTLERGGDPFNEIMKELLVLPEGYVLEVINSFEPTPLIKIARNKGFDSTVEMKGDTFYTYFMASVKVKEEPRSGDWVFNVSVAEHEARVEKCNKKIREIDVRDLEMPLPMVTILKELEELEENSALYVHHKKVPQYLLPELAERKFKTWIAEVDEYNVKLLIHK